MAETDALQARITAAADEVERLDEALDIARDRRDSLIVQALEMHVPSRRVADWARLSQSRVAGLLASR